MRARVLLLVAAALPVASACTSEGSGVTGVSSFAVTILEVNGASVPDADSPLPANRGDHDETWAFSVEARGPEGEVDTSFSAPVRVSVQPGAVMGVTGVGGLGRNLTLSAGRGEGVAIVTGVYGPARLWIEDVGYVPVSPGQAACANGQNDDGTGGNGDGLIDYPTDPGCAFANDATEEGGSFAAGVSAPVPYELPRVSDVQGGASTTPYPYEGIEVKTEGPQRLVVTRVSSDGFNVTDVGDPGGYNHLFAFNFSTPAGMRICDRVTYLSGTVNEFFGFTELSFPSFRLEAPEDVAGEAIPTCEIPPAVLLGKDEIDDPVAMEGLESALVRITKFHVSRFFGPKPAKNNVFGADQSSCDMNGDGQLDFADESEASCADLCSADPECTEWTGFAARGNYKVSFTPDGSAPGVRCSPASATLCMQINTGTVAAFDPAAHKGDTLDAVTGTLRNFSGGSLNWTIETRCPDDLVCTSPGCVPKALSSSKACVRLRSEDDNDQGTN